MSTQATETTTYKLTAGAGAGNAVALGTTAQRTVGMTLLAQKALGTVNVGNVYLRPAGSTEWWTLAPGEALPFQYLPGLHQTLDQIEMYADNAGDGVLIWRVAGGEYLGP